MQPDIFIADIEEARTLKWQQVRNLLLAMEVLSPSTARYDRFTKRRLYQEVGIPNYWIVDPDARLVEVWTPHTTEPTIEREHVTWSAQASAPLDVDLKELFRPI